MTKKNLTDRTLKALKPAPTGKRYEIMDSIVPGMGVRVTDKGQKTFMLVARFPGSHNPTRRALGTYGALTLEQARQRAREWLALLGQGVDPKAHERAKQRSSHTKYQNTFGVVAREFIRLKVIGPDPKNPLQRKGISTAREIEQEFVRPWSDIPIVDITSADVVEVLDEAVRRGAPYQAHNLLGHAKRVFNWAISRAIYGLDRSPCDRLRPSDVIGKKALRSRVLLDRELQAVWYGANGLGYPYGPLFQMLILTGQRKSEVAEARWQEFDLDARIWLIPAHRMKGDAAHLVPLTDEAVTLLRSLPRFDAGEYLFTTTCGEKPVDGFSKAKVRLDKAMQQELSARKPNLVGQVAVEPFVIHDIRRTVRTHLSALPVPDLVRELVIAHSKPGLHKVYDQHSYADEKRLALELWAQRLRKILDHGDMGTATPALTSAA